MKKKKQHKSTKKIKVLSDELEAKDLVEMLHPISKNRLNYNHSEIANLVLKVLAAHKFSVFDMELVFAIARYKVTNSFILHSNGFRK